LLSWIPRKLDSDRMNMEDRYESPNRQGRLTTKIALITKITTVIKINFNSLAKKIAFSSFLKIIKILTVIKLSQISGIIISTQ
jgi:hypothetical protein